MYDNIIVDIIGFSGSLTLTLSFIPITLKTLKQKTFTETSPHFLFLILVSSILLLIYSMYNKVYPMVIANISVLLNNLVISYYYTKHTLSETRRLNTKYTNTEMNVL